MTENCEACGQLLPGLHIEGAHNDAPPPRHDAQIDRRVTIGLATLVAIWALFALFGRSSGETDSSETAAPDLPAIEAPVAPEPELEPEGGADESAIGVLEEPTPTPRGNSIQIERLQRQLDRRGSAPTIAYRSADGIVFIDLATGTIEIAQDDVGPTSVAPTNLILRNDRDAFAINGFNRSASQVVDDSSLVVTDPAQAVTFFVAAESLSGSAPVVHVESATGERDGFTAPAGHQLVATDRGLLAVSKGPSGGTLIARPDGFALLSDHRVLAANGNTGLLEEVCTSPITCSLQVTERGARAVNVQTLHERMCSSAEEHDCFQTIRVSDDEPWAVPADFAGVGDSYVLAPDGRQLLRVTPEGFAEIYLADDAAVAWVVGQGMEAPRWGPNSEFIAWIEQVGVPKLKVMFPDERDWLSVDLPTLGAPDPIGTDFVMFASPAGG